MAETKEKGNGKKAESAEGGKHEAKAKPAPKREPKAKAGGKEARAAPAKPKTGHKDAPAKEPEKKAHAAKTPKAGHKKAPSKEHEPSAHSVNVYGLDGEAKDTVALPRAFDTQLREDLIRAAVVRAQANRRQAYGPNPRAGFRHSVEQWGKGHGTSRVMRVKGERRGAQSPGTVGGRRAHPPRLDRVWDRKMNAKERRLARMSALGATKDASVVKARGHRFKEGLTLPVVVEEAFEQLSEETDEGYTRAMVGTLEALGIYEDVVRAREGRHERAGRGKRRGRRFRTPTSLLVVVEDVEKVRRFFRNMPGVEVVNPDLLSTERLAPGGDPGRLTIISVQALEHIRGW
jgi:large subunit ribosomal protein L4e